MEAFVLRTVNEIVNFQRLKNPLGARAAKRSRVDSNNSPSLEGEKPCCKSPPPFPPFLQENRLRVIRMQLLVLRLLYSNLHLGLISTQRDVYYHLSRLIPDQGCVNRTIQQLVQLLGFPRQWLGVVPGTRGCVGGSLKFHGVDLRQHGSEGLPLPTLQEELRVTRGFVCRTTASVPPSASSATVGFLPDSIEGFELHEHTRYIIVVEKQAVFFRLMEEKIFDKVPCVLLTSHGFPTISARTLLANMHRAAPEVPVVALVDYNPSGLSILQQYKHGVGSMLESHHVAVPALCWLGLRSCHITLEELAKNDGVHHDPAMEKAVPHVLRLRPHLPFQRFGCRDSVMLSNLISRWHLRWSEAVEDNGWASKEWYAEALQMQRLQVKVELEVLYDHVVVKTPKSAHASSSSFVFTSSSSSSLSSSLVPRVLDRSDFAGWVCRALLHRDYI